jgi:hypothetical protein
MRPTEESVRRSRRKAAPWASYWVGLIIHEQDEVSVRATVAATIRLEESSKVPTCAKTVGSESQSADLRRKAASDAKVPTSGSDTAARLVVDPPTLQRIPTVLHREMPPHIG